MQADFKYIKASWGISIRISIAEQIVNEIASPLDKEIVKISENFLLSFGDVHVTQGGRRYLRKAIEDNLHILETVIRIQTIFTITSIEYAYSDYQDEGMYCVMINWLNNRFGLNIKLPEISFNSITNKYYFQF